MNDEPEIGTLPRFSRDITVLVGRGARGLAASGGAGLGVLDPFSGHLDVRTGRGRVPTLDLSYLTLAPLLAPAPGRPASRGTRAAAADLGTLNRRSAGRSPSGEASREGAESEAGEPTVREVLHRSRDTPRPRGHSYDTTDDRSDRTTGVGGESPPLGDRELADRGTADPDRTVLDPGAGEGSPQSGRARQGGGRDSRGSTRHQRNTLSSRDIGDPDRATPAGRTDRSVSDRNRRYASGTGGRDSVDGPASSEPTMRALERSSSEGQGRRHDDRRGTPTGAPPPPDGDSSESMPDPDVPPPRMITDASGGAGDATTGRAPGAAARLRSDVGRPGADRSAMGDHAAGRGPRMVLTQRGGAVPADGEDRGNGAGSDPGRPGIGGATETADRAAHHAAPLGDLLPASPDPESPAIDRLYRALKERESIERRRGGEP